MPYEAPITDPSGKFQAMFQVDGGIPDSAAYVEVILTVSEEGWTEAGVMVLFQDLIDLLSGSPLVNLVGASRTQGVSTKITATPAAGEPAPEDPPSDSV